MHCQMNKMENSVLKPTSTPPRSGIVCFPFYSSNKLRFLVILLLTPSVLLGQSGGSYGFQALNLVNNARTAALGGYNVSLTGDLALFGQNPALLDSTRAGDAVFMYNPFFADINALTFQYAADLRGIGPLAFGLTYIDYGTFNQTDASGAEMGEFHARDYVLSLGKSHRLGPFVLGSNVKFVHSGIAGFSANALALDIGGLYQVPRSNFSAGMAISNVGVILSDYSGTSVKLPMRVTAGMSFVPEGMPIRFTLTAHQLLDAQNEFYDKEGSPNFADEVFRRVSIGGEVLLSKNVNFLLGYDHGRKRELRLEETAGGAGFSYGFMINFKKYSFRFSRATYHAAGGTSYISLQSNLKEMKKLF